MSVISLSADLAIGAWQIGQARFDMVEGSDVTGDQAARLLGPPRWRLSTEASESLDADAADLWESLVLRLRGRVNVLSAWDMARPVPRGTMRGAPVLAANVAAGATSVEVAANGTLQTADWLQIGVGLGTSQLVKVTNRVESVAGTITVPFEAPLRRAYTSGTTVIWDRPVTYYRSIADQTMWRYLRGRAARRAGFALDLLEVFG